MRAIDPAGRLATLTVLLLLGALGAGCYALAVRRWWPVTTVRT
jgi:hypothetical protein